MVLVALYIMCIVESYKCLTITKRMDYKIYTTNKTEINKNEKIEKPKEKTEKVKNQINKSASSFWDNNTDILPNKLLLQNDKLAWADQVILKIVKKRKYIEIDSHHLCMLFI